MKLSDLWDAKIEKKKSVKENNHRWLYLGIITHNPPVVWAKITLPTRGLKSVT